MIYKDRPGIVKVTIALRHTIAAQIQSASYAQCLAATAQRPKLLTGYME